MVWCVSLGISNLLCHLIQSFFIASLKKRESNKKQASHVTMFFYGKKKENLGFDWWNDGLIVNWLFLTFVFLGMIHICQNVASWDVYLWRWWWWDGRLCCAECIYMSFFGTIFIIILLHNKVENHHRTYTQVLKLNLKNINI